VPFHFDKNAGLLAVKEMKTGADFELEEPPLIERPGEVRPALRQLFRVKDWRGTGLARAAAAYHLSQDDKGVLKLRIAECFLSGLAIGLANPTPTVGPTFDVTPAADQDASGRQCARKFALTRGFY
jgi:hypothetical protein